jgi:hypothetical protein
MSENDICCYRYLSNTILIFVQLIKTQRQFWKDVLKTSESVNS